jgi:NAD-dependent deacetylase
LKRDEIEQAAGLLKKAGTVAVLTGAGVSSESGIPTFRDKMTGLWANYSPEELATPEGFLKNPDLVWQWYDLRRTMVEEASPNAGHLALCALEEMSAAFTLITQNVDRLHIRAGSKNVLELHGDILTYRCFEKGHKAPFVERGLKSPPLCHCGSRLRPNVVWFGEALPPAVFELARHAASASQVFLVVGTSAVVEPAASLPRWAAFAGAKLIEINPQRTPLSSQVDIFIGGTSASVLPQVLEVLKTL